MLAYQFTIMPCYFHVYVREHNGCNGPLVVAYNKKCENRIILSDHNQEALDIRPRCWPRKPKLTCVRLVNFQHPWSTSQLNIQHLIMTQSITVQYLRSNIGIFRLARSYVSLCTMIQPSLWRPTLVTWLGNRFYALRSAGVLLFEQLLRWNSCSSKAKH